MKQLGDYMLTESVGNVLRFCWCYLGVVEGIVEGDMGDMGDGMGKVGVGVCRVVLRKMVNYYF